MNTCTRAILGQTQKYVSEYASKYGSPYCTVAGTIWSITLWRRRLWGQHTCGAQLQNQDLWASANKSYVRSDPLTISDKVSGIFRIKEISISPTDPPILLFRVDFDLCHHGGEADKREILCWPAFPNMSRLLTLALCTLHIAHRDWGLGSVGSAAFHWRFAQICAARYRLGALWHISSTYMLTDWGLGSNHPINHSSY